MKSKKLLELCSVQMGYSFRSRMSKDDRGCFVIQLKDIDAEGCINMDGLDRVAKEGFKETHFVEKGDIVFRSRGILFKAAIVPDFEEKLLFAAPLLRLRVAGSEILPEYLSWYINQPKGQLYFDGVAAGSAIKMISKAMLSEMEIELPVIGDQKAIVELDELKKTEAVLFREIMKKREKLVNTRIMQFFQEVQK